jgi:tetratricopeptide (TPR) repeat protein
MCAIVDSQDVLVDAHYRDSMDSRTIEREFLRPLREQGFVFRRVNVALAQRLLANASRRRALLGNQQPRGFYLGRDLFGLFDEHLPRVRRLDRRLDLAALLSRALELCADRQYEQARPLFETYLAAAPDDDEARTGLGVSLLQLGDPVGAEREFQRVVEKQPDNAMYLWNLASAARQGGHDDICCSALQRYLAVGDLEDANSEREQRARDLIAEYERLRGCTADTIALKSSE